MEHYDYIIIGAGAAGLSLAWSIFQTPLLQHKNILIVDRSFTAGPNKTWCYWSEKAFIDAINQKSWSKMKYSDGQSDIVEGLSSMDYHCMFSHDFRDFIIQQLQGQSEHFTFRESTVISHEQLNSVCQVKFQDGSACSASYVFDSTLSTSDFDEANMFQSFLGYFISLDQGVVNPDTFTLMEFSNDYEGNSFLYELPFSSNQLLVEFTVVDNVLYSQDELEEKLQILISEKYPNSRIDRKEYGSIPLGLNQSSDTGSNYIKIGTAAGVTKPSTGYTFHFIQQHCRQLVKGLVRKNEKQLAYKPSIRHRFYDSILMAMLEKTPSYLKPFTSSLFKNDFRNVIRFLNEETNLIQDFLLFTKLPWMPFIKQTVIHFLGLKS